MSVSTLGLCILFAKEDKNSGTTCSTFLQLHVIYLTSWQFELELFDFPLYLLNTCCIVVP